ncbi:hypothetical protein D9V32_02960 [Mycetocola tolaasinivorans]|uniref:Uncharacterized protein n=1 Tax=Mycetocola tolaasinivorans TaxID=76635 RepID=A0A3L7ADG3_9MICO|nr:hypothetical protein [Mycetocola tolaasinivorans]RLP77422.1 hypothetical protein D9V32_02960 [Mycetocola tolaasinivorans]
MSELHPHTAAPFVELWDGLTQWAPSTGFAGVAASAAAMITVFITRKKQREDIWWRRTEWALTHYFGRLNAAEGTAALNMLIMLSSSPLGGKHGRDLLNATMGSILRTPVNRGHDEDKNIVMPHPVQEHGSKEEETHDR